MNALWAAAPHCGSERCHVAAQCAAVVITDALISSAARPSTSERCHVAAQCAAVMITDALIESERH
jgi:hypothetical protein